MKTTLFFCALALNAIAAQPVLVRVTPDTLAKLKARDPMIRLVNSPELETNTNKPASHSITERSTVLHDGKNWTLVPNGALVHLPAAMKARVNVSPVGILLPWNQFFIKNRNWIVTNEVTFDQAAGNEELPTDRTDSWAKQDKVVVAVHLDAPAAVRMAPHFPSLTSR